MWLAWFTTGSELARTSAPRGSVRLNVEALEARDVPSVDLRIATYNIGKGVRTGMETVLRAMGDQVVNGVSRPIDILAIQEVDPSLTYAQGVANLLNGIYGTGSYSYSTVAGAGDTTQALVYRTSTVQLLSTTPIGTVSSTGMARQAMRFHVRPVGFGTTNDIYIYNSHTKASSGTENQSRRNVEAQIIRADADALGNGANVIYVGDLNLYSNAEPAYVTFTSSGAGQAVDPLGSGNWTGSSNAWKHTQSPAVTAAYGGQVTGGVDDRFDFQLVSGEFYDGVGIDIVASTYRVLGNNGTTYDKAIKDATNTWSWTAVAGSPVTRTALLNALASITDHLPVLADYDIITVTPTIGSFGVSPTSVTAGSQVTLTASNVTGGTISSVNFYRESNGVAGLQIGSDLLVGGGTQSGSTWTRTNVSTSGLTAGTYTYYAVANNTSGGSSVPSTTTLTVTNPTTSGTLLGWEVGSQVNFGTQGLTAATVMSGVSNSIGLTRGSGVTTSGTAASGGWGGANWAATSSAGITGNQFITFRLTVGSGVSASLSSLDLFYRRSSTGPSGAYWQYQINSGSWNLIGNFSSAFSSTATTGAQMTQLNLSGISGLQNLPAGTNVTFRLTPYGATSSSGTFYVFNKSGNDLVLTGTRMGVPASAARIVAAAPAPIAPHPWMPAHLTRVQYIAQVASGLIPSLRGDAAAVDSFFTRPRGWRFGAR